MTVSELISHLQTQPTHKEVFLSGINGDTDIPIASFETNCHRIILLPNYTREKLSP